MQAKDESRRAKRTGDRGARATRATLRAAACGEIEVTRLSGTEAISRPYRFELELVCDRPDLDAAALVGREASLAWQAGGLERRFGGVVERFEQGDAVGRGRYAYHAVVVPRLALSGLGRESRIYQGMTALEIVLAVLARHGIGDDQIDVRVERALPRRRYVVQYQESALSFVSRLLEDEGIAYTFESDGGPERLVLCDHNAAYAAGPSLRYRRAARRGGARVDAMRVIRDALPARVLVRDGDPNDPELPLEAAAAVDPQGTGLFVDDARFDDPALGVALAELRAEGLRCRAQRIAIGCRAAVSSGRLSPLEDHFRASFNRPLLVTSVHHHLAETGYQAEIEAQFADLPFRPARVTPRPKLNGVMHARLDAAGPGDEAAIDDQGRYRVVMPFDPSGAEEGQATAPMRLAQPYGGADHGMHLALPKGTEVVWTCFDGDPDRPVITGAVPSIEAPSLVRRDNAQSAILRASGGPTLELRGARRRPETPMTALQHLTTDADDADVEAVNADPSIGQAEKDLLTNLESQQDTLQGDVADLQADVGELQDATGKLGTQSGAGNHDTWFKIDVPHTASTTQSYVRYGEEPNSADETVRGRFTNEITLNVVPSDKTYTDAALSPDFRSNVRGDGESNSTAKDRRDAYIDGAKRWGTSGAFDATDRNRTLITAGNYESITGGKYLEHVYGDVHRRVEGSHRFDIAAGGLGLRDASVLYFKSFDPMPGSDKLWYAREVSHASSVSVSWGDSESYSAAYGFGASVGADVGVKLGLSAGVNASASVDLSATASLGISLGASCDISFSKSFSYSPSQSMSASKEITLSVDPIAGASHVTTKIAAGVALGIGAAVTLTSIGTFVGTVAQGAEYGDGTDEGEKQGVEDSLEFARGWAFAAGPIVAASALVAAIVAMIAAKKKAPNPIAPKIEMKPGKIVMQCGNAYLHLKNTGILIGLGATPTSPTVLNGIAIKPAGVRIGNFAAGPAQTTTGAHTYQ